MDAKALLAQLNVVARTEYNKAYQAYEPALKGLLYEYPSGPVETMNFPFFAFLSGMELFTGSRKHQTFPEGYNFQVTNKEYDMGVDIPMKDIERAASANNMAGLNIYKQRIAEMPAVVKDHPIELALDMLEAGDASTYGLCFDGQNLFDTTHDYGTAAGTQDNVITTGSGVTVANLITDLTTAISRMNGFYFYQGGTSNGKKRKLNKDMSKLLVVCPDELFGKFDQIRTQRVLASGEENPMYGRFEVVSRPFTDTGDWYLVNMANDGFGLFLYQVEKPSELDMPTLQDESYREHKFVTYGAYGRYTVACGAWWKGVMVNNT